MLHILTSQIVRDTVDFGSPMVSPITWRKLPEAKKRNASRTWTVADKAWFREICRSRSSRRSFTKNITEYQPKRKRLLSSSSEMFVKSMSCILYFFSWCGNAKRSNNESAILFVLKNFNPKVSELIHLTRCIKFHTWFISWIALILLSKDLI